MTSRRAKLNDDKHFRLMRILESTPDLSQREIAQALGISFGGVNYCLNALVDKGLVMQASKVQGTVRSLQNAMRSWTATALTIIVSQARQSTPHITT